MEESLPSGLPMHQTFRRISKNLAGLLLQDRKAPKCRHLPERLAFEMPQRLLVFQKSAKALADVRTRRMKQMHPQKHLVQAYAAAVKCDYKAVCRNLEIHLS